MANFKRTKALVDKSAWMLIIPPLIVLYFVDQAMMQTMLQWMSFAPVLAGVAIIVSRVVFPQIHLTTLVGEAIRGNSAAAIVAASLILFVSLVVLALVIWAKA